MFRPLHLKAAVAAGKHIFAEKPIATDCMGVKTALEAVKTQVGSKTMGLDLKTHRLFIPAADFKPPADNPKGRPVMVRRMVDAGHASEDDTTTHRGTLVWKTGAAIRHPADREKDCTLAVRRDDTRGIARRLAIDAIPCVQ